jgi:RNA polymerase sigma factor (sigma-70 family)
LERLFVSWWRIKADPMAYADKTMVNLAHNRRRWRRRHVETPLDLAPEPAELDRTDQFLARTDVVQALQQLSAGQRAVIVLRYLEDLSESQTAAALGVSTGTVKSQTARAMARLRQILTTIDAASELPAEGGAL